MQAGIKRLIQGHFLPADFTKFEERFGALPFHLHRSHQQLSHRNGVVLWREHIPKYCVCCTFLSACKKAVAVNTQYGPLEALVPNSWNFRRWSSR